MISRRWTRIWAGCVALAVALSLWAGVVRADAQREYQVKAAFLYNFAKFVEWPARVFGASTAPLTFCIIGEDPFGPVLDATLEGRTVGGRGIAVVRASADAPPSGCQLAFIAVDGEREMARIVQIFSRAAVLTVGESPDFVEVGGMIRLFVDANKVRFDVNARVADRAGLRVSSQLLKLARSVEK